MQQWKPIAAVVIAINLQACVTTSPAIVPQSIDTAEIAASDNVQLGLAYLKQSDIARAKSKLLMALHQAPSWPAAQDAMGYFLETTGDTQNAEAYYKRAITLAPDDGAALNNYGTFLCRTHRVQAAEKMFLAAVNDKQYLYTAEAYENAGLCALTIHDNAKAQYYFQKAIKQNPKLNKDLSQYANK